MNLRQLNAFGATRRPGAASLLTAALLMAVLLLALAACGGDQPASTPAPSPAAVTVETGSMALPDAAPVGTAAAEATADGTAADSAPVSGAAADSPAPAAPPALAPGAQIVTDSRVSLYAEPDRTSLRFAEYAAGSRLTVIEPDDDRAAYPVVVDDRRWYRVRAEDGLVGWLMEP